MNVRCHILWHASFPSCEAAGSSVCLTSVLCCTGLLLCEVSDPPQAFETAKTDAENLWTSYDQLVSNIDNAFYSVDGYLRDAQSVVSNDLLSQQRNILQQFQVCFPRSLSLSLSLSLLERKLSHSLLH